MTITCPEPLVSLGARCLVPSDGSCSSLEAASGGSGHQREQERALFWVTGFLLCPHVAEGPRELSRVSLVGTQNQSGTCLGCEASTCSAPSSREHGPYVPGAVVCSSGEQTFENRCPPSPEPTASTGYKFTRSVWFLGVRGKLLHFPQNLNRHLAAHFKDPHSPSFLTALFWLFLRGQAQGQITHNILSRLLNVFLHSTD